MASCNTERHRYVMFLIGVDGFKSYIAGVGVLLLFCGLVCTRTSTACKWLQCILLFLYFRQRFSAGGVDKGLLPPF